MNKQTKMILGVVLLGGVGYYIWKKNQAPKGFANMAALKDSCKCHTEVLDGVYLCGDGKSLARKSAGPCGTKNS